MEKLANRLILSNIISAILIVLSSASLKGNHDFIFNGRSWPLGVGILISLCLGMYFSIIKARAIGQRSSVNPGIVKGFFLFLLYLFSLLANFLIYISAMCLMVGSIDGGSEPLKVAGILFLVTIFTLLIFEGFSVSGASKRQVSRGRERTANLFVMIYMNVGISITWDALILGGSRDLDIHQSDIIPELLACVALTLMLLFPFQRLYWYEVLTTSTTRKDNLKILAAICVVILAAISPMFFL